METGDSGSGRRAHRRTGRPLGRPLIERTLVPPAGKDLPRFHRGHSSEVLAGLVSGALRSSWPSKTIGEGDDEHLREARAFLDLTPAEQSARLRRESVAVAPPWKRPKRPRPALERCGRRKWIESPLANWMKASGIRAKDLADRLEVTTSNVYQWLRGERFPTIKTAKAIANIARWRPTPVGPLTLEMIRPKREGHIERRGRPPKWVSSPLADWMKASKIRADDLADRLGVNTSNVYRWFRGEQNPSLKTAQAIAEIARAAGRTLSLEDILRRYRIGKSLPPR